MSLVRFRSAAALALCSAIVLLAGAGDAQAQQKKITRLGNPGTRITAPVKDTAALQKTFATKRNQAAISARARQSRPDGIDAAGDRRHR